MYLAQESTATTHRFNHSRKKPPRAKAKPSHRQGPLFADMLHETTSDQRQYAHHVCGSTTVYNKKGGLRLYCGRRDCATCFKRRYRKIATRIRGYKIATEKKLYWWRIDSKTHTRAVRAIRRADGDYICMPVINKYGVEQEIIICSILSTPGGQPLHTDHPRLETNLAVWTKTPEGHRISFSKGFKLRDLSPSTEKSTNFFARISLSKIGPYAELVGGTIENRSQSYIKWRDVDTKKLTTKLVEDDIVAYQVTLPLTLNEEVRNAEDAALASIEAVPVNGKGKALAPPVKLRHILNESIGIGLRVTESVAPLVNQTEAQATSPPPG